MAIAYYMKDTRQVWRVVYADDQTDDELLAVRPLPADQGVVRFEGTFNGIENHDGDAVQAIVDEALGRG